MIQLVEENNQLKHALGEWSEQLTKHFHQSVATQYSLDTNIKNVERILHGGY